jgi:hypothetical protein
MEFHAPKWTFLKFLNQVTGTSEAQEKREPLASTGLKYETYTVTNVTCT